MERNECDDERVLGRGVSGVVNGVCVRAKRTSPATTSGWLVVVRVECMLQSSCVSVYLLWG